jgi:4-amino-4-deoxy-L-arabinose transferase-like glycosyltransferase
MRAAGISGWGVTPTTEGIQPSLTVGRAATDYRLAVWYLPPSGAERSYLSEAGTMFDRAALFAAGFVRPWLFYLVLFVLLPVVAILAVRCLALAAAGRGRRLALWLYVLVALNGTAWALITPAFQGPDEVDHFAYAQALVERGQRPTPYPGSSRLRWSIAENDALLGSAMITDHQAGDTRVPWLAADVHRYRQLARSQGADRADGGGFDAMSGYGPLYYLAVAPGYAIAGSSVFTQLTMMRLLSVLIGALSAVFAYLIVRELAPRKAWMAVLAGLLVGFQPMYAFLSGTVNNDIGVDAGTAAVAYLLVRMLRRGIAWRTTLPLGVLLGVLPFVKDSAYELYPLTLLAVAAALWTHRAGRKLSWRTVGETARSAGWGLAALAVPAAVAYKLSGLVTNAVTPPAPTHGAVNAAATASGTLGLALHNPLSYLTYLWEVFLPRLPGMHPHYLPGVHPASVIFLHRGWAAFGWYDVSFPPWVYDVLLGVMLAFAVLGVLALWRERRLARPRWAEIALLVLFPVVVVAAFEAVFFTTSVQAVIPEFGRYAFPALAPLAALVVGALYGLGRRRMLAAGAILLVATLALSYASQLLTLTAFYS